MFASSFLYGLNKKDPIDQIQKYALEITSKLITIAVSYTHFRAHMTVIDHLCRILL